MQLANQDYYYHNSPKRVTGDASKGIWPDPITLDEPRCVDPKQSVLSLINES